jgi:hypothetical protein
MGLLIADKNIKIFDLEQIGRGDCVRLKHTGDTQYKTGFVVNAKETVIQVLCCNIQGNATSYLNVPVDEVAAEEWDIAWTRDFETVCHEPDTL